MTRREIGGYWLCLYPVFGRGVSAALAGLSTLWDVRRLTIASSQLAVLQLGALSTKAVLRFALWYVPLWVRLGGLPHAVRRDRLSPGRIFA